MKMLKWGMIGGGQGSQIDRLTQTMCRNRGGKAAALCQGRHGQRIGAGDPAHDGGL